MINEPFRAPPGTNPPRHIRHSTIHSGPPHKWAVHNRSTANTSNPPAVTAAPPATGTTHNVPKKPQDGQPPEHNSEDRLPVARDFASAGIFLCLQPVLRDSLFPHTGMSDGGMPTRS
jgi:hypothetical protein